MGRRSQIFFQSITPPAGDVDFVGTSTTNIKSGSGDTQSFSHTRPVTTKGALVVKSMNDTPVNTITYGGVSLTKIREEGFAGSGSSFWMGNNSDMPTGSNTVLITFSSGTLDAVANVNNLENVDQTTMSDANNGANGNGGGSDLSVTITLGGLAMDCIASDSFGNDKTQGAPQVELNNDTDGFVEAASSYHTDQSAGSRTLGWDWSFNNDFGHVEVAVKNG